MARLAFLLPNLANGGAERVSLALAGGFLSRGHEVDLVAAQAKGELIAELPDGAQLVDLNARRLRGALFPLIRYLRQRRPAALLASMWPLTIVAIVAGRLSGADSRILVSDHSILSRQYGGRGRAMTALRWTTRLFYPLADERIGVSTGVTADLAEISGIPRSRFRTIFNPVSAPPPALATNPEVERLWAGATQRILTVGMLKPAKNHELLIRAFALLTGSPSAKLMIVGEGEERPKLEALIGELGLEGRVLLPGFTANLWPMYASSNLFVLSSDREGLGNVLIEAMLAGLPVVSTDCETGPREILDGGRLGRLVPVGDAAALTQAISRALEAPHDPAAGRRRAAQLCETSPAQYLEAMLGQDSRDSTR